MSLERLGRHEEALPMRRDIHAWYKANLGELRRQKGGGIVEREVGRLEEEWRKWE